MTRRRYVAMRNALTFRTTALIGTLVVSLLSGCAIPSLSKNQCLAGDWHGIGFDDGRQGYTDARINQHAEACEELGIVPRVTEYRAGWNEGVRGFCTPSQGMRSGRQGDSYHGLCPPDLEPGFLNGYDAGLRDFCAPARGYEAGRYGSAYRGNVCPPALEFAYRRAYEDGLRVQRARAQIEAIERERNGLMRQLERTKDEKEKHQIIERLDRLHGELHRATNSLLFLENSLPSPWPY